MKSLVLHIVVLILICKTGKKNKTNRRILNYYYKTIKKSLEFYLRLSIPTASKQSNKWSDKTEVIAKETEIVEVVDDGEDNQHSWLYLGSKEIRKWNKRFGLPFPPKSKQSTIKQWDQKTSARENNKQNEKGKAFTPTPGWLYLGSKEIRLWNERIIKQS